MLLAKRLILGSAAAFVATSGAHAADLGLPVAPSVDYVQICSIGSFTGFILPGSDVCFDISGYARGQLTWREEVGLVDFTSATFTAASSPLSINPAGILTDYTAGVITIDANETDVYTGLNIANGVATAIDLTAIDLGDRERDELAWLGNARLEFDARTMTEYGLLRGFIRLDGENGTAANVDHAYVQLNVGSLGFTAGMAPSVFDPVFTGYGPGPGAVYTGDGSITQFSVHAAVGNGFTVSLSVEDEDPIDGGIGTLTVNDVSNAATIAITESSADGGASIPDFIAAVRVDQAWGSAKLAAMLSEVNPAGSVVDSEFGYALSASAEVNLPFGVGSTFGVTGIYTHGSEGSLGYERDIGNSIGVIFDGMILTDTATATSTLDLTTAYVIAAGFNFGLSNELVLHVDGAYADVDQLGTIFDSSTFTMGGAITYAPVNNLSIAAGFAYSVMDSEFMNSTFSGGVDDDEWAGRFRVTRSF